MRLWRRSRAAARRALVVGWFSLPYGGGTAGDLAALDVVRGVLADAGWPHDVALGEPFEGGVDWRAASPLDYSHVIMVCGPVSPELEVAGILERFDRSEAVAVNVSLVPAAAGWKPFEHLLARDGDGPPRPDLAWLAPRRTVPVIGTALVHEQAEYPGAAHAEVGRAIHELLAARECAEVEIDTRLDLNSHGLRTVAELESLIGKLDVLVTTRLHGLVFALRAGVPALAVDPIAGGAKVAAQARAIGWPAVLTPEGAGAARLAELLDWCLSDAARAEAEACARRAADAAAAVRDELRRALGPGPG
jgi:Polysaccharide pyruvyl transferase